MIAAEEIKLMDAKELSMTYAYGSPETEEIKAEKPKAGFGPF